jgi:pyruvate/2-oxoglutarate dehydrogenase complex dihydrolipoamide acyltransferase (E2) component
MSDNGGLVSVKVPDLGETTVVVCQWLVDVGSRVQRGDRLVELLAASMVYQLEAETTGIVVRIESPSGSQSQAGSILAWVLPDDD